MLLSCGETADHARNGAVVFCEDGILVREDVSAHGERSSNYLGELPAKERVDESLECVVEVTGEFQSLVEYRIRVTKDHRAVTHETPLPADWPRALGRPG